MPTKTIAAANQKGCVGKTTTAVHLAAGMALEGYTTLLVDLDPQANATAGLGVTPAETQIGIYDVLINETPPGEAVLPTNIAGRRILPADKHYKRTKLKFFSKLSSNILLRLNALDILLRLLIGITCRSVPVACIDATIGSFTGVILSLLASFVFCNL